MIKMKTIIHEDILPGGHADNMSDDNFKPCSLEIGIAVEMEHTTDAERAKEIAKDHLSSDNKYYKKLIEAGLVDEPKALALYKKHSQACAVNNEVQTESKVGDYMIEIEETTDATLVSLAKLKKLYDGYVSHSHEKEELALLDGAIKNIEKLQYNFSQMYQ